VTQKRKGALKPAKGGGHPNQNADWKEAAKSAERAVKAAKEGSHPNQNAD
jgi:hypothetical protein